MTVKGSAWGFIVPAFDNGSYLDRAAHDGIFTYRHGLFIDTAQFVRLGMLAAGTEISMVISIGGQDYPSTQGISVLAAPVREPLAPVDVELDGSRLRITIP